MEPRGRPARSGDPAAAVEAPAPARSWRRHLPALALGLGIVVAVDLLIARVDVFTALLPAAHPMTFLAGINNQLTRAVRLLYPRPDGPRAVVLLGNSAFGDAGGPLSGLAAALEQRGAPADAPVLSLCVAATYPTDDEVLASRLAPVRPGLVLVGLSASDLATPLERARTTPVTQLLDTGFRDGLVTPEDWARRRDRWVRTVWRLYRYRALFRDIVLPPAGPRIPAADLERRLTPSEFFALFYGPERARELEALRAGYERDGSYASFLAYLEVLRGPGYVEGVRSRWRELRVEPLQVEALRRVAGHVRAAGGEPVWVLLPENPLLQRDPEVGPEVRERSDAVAGQLAREATALGVPLLDLRRTLPESAFVDLNHVFVNSGALLPALAGALAERRLLTPAAAS